MNKRGGLWFLGFSAVAATFAGIWFGTQSQAPVDNTGSAFLQLEFEPVLATPAVTAPANPSMTKLEKIGNGSALTVVNFWATWCAPCIEELPAVSALATKYPKIRFVGIGVDSESKVRGFIQSTPLVFPVSASGAAAVEWTKSLGNEKGGLPFTVVIDAKGSILQQISGTIDLIELEKQLAQLSN